MKAPLHEVVKSLDLLRVDAQKYPDGLILETTYARSVVRIAQQTAFSNWGRRTDKKAP